MSVMMPVFRLFCTVRPCSLIVLYRLHTPPAAPVIQKITTILIQCVQTRLIPLTHPAPGSYNTESHNNNYTMCTNKSYTAQTPRPRLLQYRQTLVSILILLQPRKNQLPEPYNTVIITVTVQQKYVALTPLC